MRHTKWSAIGKREGRLNALAGPDRVAHAAHLRAETAAGIARAAARPRQNLPAARTEASAHISSKKWLPSIGGYLEQLKGQPHWSAAGGITSYAPSGVAWPDQRTFCQIALTVA
jgi:hypothetical protein